MRPARGLCLLDGEAGHESGPLSGEAGTSDRTSPVPPDAIRRLILTGSTSFTPRLINDFLNRERRLDVPNMAVSELSPMSTNSRRFPGIRVRHLETAVIYPDGLPGLSSTFVLAARRIYFSVIITVSNVNRDLNSTLPSPLPWFG